ncbi:unnamed protein product [Adineta ricciae]|uniref:Uncharacterized protein n=1 Tax=Adineta ricciae TaxID=249248 RepID=A0A815G7J5_ADIRI|nr:unnamed protein product [Adineta ricciae]CAF1335557.1 unnamed protein product [Adineta ricciae]
MIGITASLLLYTVNKSESSPSLSTFQYLVNKYPKTMNCPCSNIGITYQTFIDINVKFHQVCSSQYITKSWIESVFAQRNLSSFKSDDIHQMLSFFWQIIADFCTISSQAFHSAIINFGSSFILSPKAIAPNIIENEIYSELNGYIASIQTGLLENLIAIQRTISGNQYVSALTNNFYFIAFNEQNSIRMSPKESNNCSCMRITVCSHPVLINETIIPGLILDCYLIDATLASTFECYYNQTCFSLLHENFSSSVKLLSSEQNRQVALNSTIQSLLERLMIDDLTIEIHFDLFYDQCKPTFCSYSYSHRFDVMFVITTLISSFGALSLILPYVAQSIAIIILYFKEKKTKRTDENATKSVKQILMLGIRFIYENIINLNLFENELTDAKYIYEQRFTTRLFILFFTIHFIIISIFVIIPKQSQLITISQPSEEEYRQLNDKYDSLVTCPCSQISVPYGTFLNVNFVIHQICSSDLVSVEWINYLSSFNPMNVTDWIIPGVAQDFRIFGASYFQLLQVFCQLANKTIENAQHVFLTTEFINNNLISPDIFYQKSTHLMEIFIRTTQNTFIQSYQWLEVVNTINLFITGTKSNFDESIIDHQLIFTDKPLHQAVFIRYGILAGAGPCKCSTRSNNCAVGLLLFKNASDMLDDAQFFSEIPYGCIPWKGFVGSTIAWWYDPSYIDDIRNTYIAAMPTSFSPIVIPLKRLTNDSFIQKQTKYLIENMFIETIVKSPGNFSAFYHQCAPRSCSYTIVQRQNIFVLIVLLVSISKGLNGILRLLIPLLSRIIIYFLHKFLHPFRNLTKTRISIIQQLKQLFKSIRLFNLFQSDRNDAISLHLQLIYTRVYLIMFIICLVILIFYESVIERTATIITSNPSLQDYEQLLRLYPDNVNCPCTQIAIPYSKIVTQLNVTSFHQVCTTSLLLNMLEIGRPLGSIGTSNGSYFDSWRSLFLGGLNILCQLAISNVNNSIEMFLSSTMLTYQMIPRNIFNQQIDTSLTRFQKQLPIEFNRTLELIRATSHDNALIAYFPSNWNIFVTNDTNSFITEPIVYTSIDTNSSCSCATERSCAMPVLIYDYANESYFNLPENVFYSCTLIETILHSSLFCFYSDVCVLRYRRLTSPGRLQDRYFNQITACIFNASLTHFARNDTIETMASSMFIESWLSNTSYENFCKTCSPTECISTYRYRFDIFEIFTAFLSIYAGIAIILRFLVPHLITIITKIRNYKRVRPH